MQQSNHWGLLIWSWFKEILSEAVWRVIVIAASLARTIKECISAVIERILEEIVRISDKDVAVIARTSRLSRVNQAERCGNKITKEAGWRRILRQRAVNWCENEEEYGREWGIFEK